MPAMLLHSGVGLHGHTYSKAPHQHSQNQRLHHHSSHHSKPRQDVMQTPPIPETDEDPHPSSAVTTSSNPILANSLFCPLSILTGISLPNTMSICPASAQSSVQTSPTSASPRESPKVRFAEPDNAAQSSDHSGSFTTGANDNHYSLSRGGEHACVDSRRSSFVPSLISVDDGGEDSPVNVADDVHVSQRPRSTTQQQRRLHIRPVSLDAAPVRIELPRSSSSSPSSSSSVLSVTSDFSTLSSNQSTLLPTSTSSSSLQSPSRLPGQHQQQQQQLQSSTTRPSTQYYLAPPPSEKKKLLRPTLMLQLQSVADRLLPKYNVYANPFSTSLKVVLTDYFRELEEANDICPGDRSNVMGSMHYLKKNSSSDGASVGVCKSGKTTDSASGSLDFSSKISVAGSSSTPASVWTIKMVNNTFCFTLDKTTEEGKTKHRMKTGKHESSSGGSRSDLESIGGLCGIGGEEENPEYIWALHRFKSPQDYGFCFCQRLPSTKRHPVLARLTPQFLEIYHTYQPVSRVKSLPPPSSASASTSVPLSTASAKEIPESLRPFIVISAVWVSLHFKTMMAPFLRPNPSTVTPPWQSQPPSLSRSQSLSQGPTASPSSTIVSSRSRASPPISTRSSTSSTSTSPVQSQAEVYQPPRPGPSAIQPQPHAQPRYDGEHVSVGEVTGSEAERRRDFLQRRRHSLPVSLKSSTGSVSRLQRVFRKRQPEE